ncbi:MAG TPA: ATP-binding protein, partial [Chryseosolibacter sp.]
QDITEAKKAEEMLKTNLKTLVQAEKVAGMGSWDFDVASNKLYWSDGMYKIFGLEKGTPVQPEAYLEYAFEEDLEVARRITNKHLGKPEPFEEKIRIRAGDKIRTLKIKGTVLKSESKKPLKVVGICVDVTAITESEHALREQSHFVSNIVKTVPDIINVVNLATGEFEYINRLPFNSVDFTLEDFQRLPFSEREKMVHPDDVETVKTYYKTFLSLPDDVANTVECRARFYEGEWEWFRLHGKVFSRNSEGIPTHCVNVVQNITETKRSQDEVIRMKETLAQKAQARYEELFRSIDQGFAIIELITDEKGKPFDFLIHQANPALEKITGLRNISGRRLRELLADPLDDWFMTFGKIIRTQQPLRFTVKADELGGNWFDINAFPTGEVSSNRVAILFNDITDRISQEEKLLDKQLKLDIAQKAARVGVWTYDLNLQQGMATSEWIELTGYPDASETWSLERFLPLVHTDDAPSIKSAFDSARKQTGIEVEFRINHPTRGLQWFLMRGSYIPSGNGANDSLMGNIIDITDRKAFEEQKDQFIGIASHELKTPVTSIKAYAEILHGIYGKQNIGSQESMMMERMVSQVDRLVKLINDLLDTTRITAGGLVLEQESFDLNELIQERVEEIQRATSHRLIVKPHNIPLVYADKDRISQVLTNLLSNAIKYSPTASEVTITSERSDSHVIVRVRDLGIGLPEEHRDKIFDRFYRMYDTRHNTAQGLGLGLFIASEIIRKHHGTMGVQSKQGEGSEFYFTLPLKPI